MALRTLEIGKAISEKRAALAELESKENEFETRKSELAARIEKAETEDDKRSIEIDVETLETEKRENEAKKESYRAEIEKLEKDLEEIEAKTNAEPATKEERKIDTMDNTKMDVRSSKEYLDAFVKAIKTNDDTEVRSLLSENAPGGTVPVPTYLDPIIRQAWENDQIMALVHRTNFRGNLKIGFEISSTGATVHVEGDDAPDEEELTLGIVTLVPESIKKWISISDEAMDLTGEEFLRYIADELTYHIVKQAAAALLGLIATLPTTATSTSPSAAVVKEAPAMGTVADAISNLADGAANPVIVMNKQTWAAFKAVQYANGFNADPFEGLRVIFNNTLPAYNDASEDDVYMIVGDFGFGAQANFPNGDNVKITVEAKPKEDMVEVTGRQFVALGVVCCSAFTNVTKPAGI